MNSVSCDFVPFLILVLMSRRHHFSLETTKIPLIHYHQAIDDIQFEYSNCYEVLRVGCQNLDAAEQVMIKFDF